MSNRWAQLRADLKSQQRRAITRAAIRLLEDRGVAGISMTALAEEAEVSRQTLYNYFSSVEEAIVAYLLDEIAIAEEEMTAHLEGIDDPGQRLEVFIGASVERFNRRDIQLTMEAAMSPEARQVVSEALAGLQDHLRAIIVDGMESGEFAPDLEPEMTTQMLFCMIGGTAPLVHAGTDPDQVAGHCARLLKAAVRPEA